MFSEAGSASVAFAERHEGAVTLDANSRRILEDSFNRGDFTSTRALMAPDAVIHDPSLPRSLQGVRGPEPYIQTVAAFRQAFPDLRVQVDFSIAAGDKVALRWTASGTHRGSIRGLASTGTHGSVTGISITRWHNDKVAEVWVEWDYLGLARQIGAAPAEGSLAERVGIAIQHVIARRLRQRSADRGTP